MAPEATSNTEARKSKTSRRRWDRCVLRCALLCEANCKRCPIPGPRGESRCPRCRGRLYYLDVREGRGYWGCNNLTGCGATVSVPTADPASEAAADAELAEHRRKKDRIRQAKSRARRRGWD
jgi:hypothetical protein